jgi:hypothetical protein
MGLTGTPQAVRRLRDHLHGEGFKVTRERTGGMGGLEQVFEGQIGPHAMALRITSDRGHWAIEVQVGKMARWIVPGEWEAYLDGHEMVELDIDAQVEFVLSRLSDAVLSYERDENLETALRRIGERFMHRSAKSSGS